MKNVGIITNTACNYGSLLQAYALTTAIGKIDGFQAEIIRYNQVASIKQKISRKTYVLWSRKTDVDYWLNRAARYFFEMKRNRNHFFPFLNDTLRTSEKVYSEWESFQDEARERYDVCVCGSDQVWNPLLYKTNPLYYLRFMPENRRFSYAPSVGVSKIPAAYRDTMARYISEIPYLSCREESGGKIIKELTGRDVTHTVDPTFLLSEDEWRAFARFERVPDKPYIFAYFLQNDRYMRERTARLANKAGLPVVVAPISYLDVCGGRFQRRFDLGPREFVGLLAEAKWVCSDSFHGTAFSINLRKPFLSFRRHKKCVEAATGSRITDLLKKLELSEREVTRESPIGDAVGDVDYARPSEILSRWRETSIQYLNLLSRF